MGCFGFPILLLSFSRGYANSVPEGISANGKYLPRSTKYRLSTIRSNNHGFQTCLGADLKSDALDDSGRAYVVQAYVQGLVNFKFR